MRLHLLLLLVGAVLIGVALGMPGDQFLLAFSGGLLAGHGFGSLWP